MLEMLLTFLDRIPQNPLRLMFHFEPSLRSRERFPEKIPSNQRDHFENYNSKVNKHITQKSKSCQKQDLCGSLTFTFSWFKATCIVLKDKNEGTINSFKSQIIPIKKPSQCKFVMVVSVRQKFVKRFN